MFGDCLKIFVPPLSYPFSFQHGLVQRPLHNSRFFLKYLTQVQGSIEELLCVVLGRMRHHWTPSVVLD